MKMEIDDVSENKHNNNININEKIPKKRKKTEINWIKEKTFFNNDSVLNFIKQEDTWGYQAQCVNSDGNIIARYRCNKVKFRGPQCAATLRIIYKSSTNEICLYRSSADHDHDNILSKSLPKLRPSVIEEIKTIFMQDNKIRPKKVLDILSEKHDNLPTYRQVVNMLLKLRTEEYSPTIISLGELKKLLVENDKTSDNDDISYVVHYEINDEEPAYFRFFISTKTLLKTAMKTEHLHINGNDTSQLMWQGFPVLVIGTTDRHREFHCCGIAVCSNESISDFAFIFQALKKGIQNCCEGDYKPKVLITDGSDSVKTAFQQIFGNDTLIIMCWSHVHKNILKKLKEFVPNKKIRQEILKDIEYLQLSKNAFIFMDALNLFIDKWKDEVLDFIDYFKENCVNQNCNWYEAACNFVPSTNNALKTFDRDIRFEYVLREKLPMSTFLTKTLKYLTKYSHKYKFNQITFHDTPNISLDTWTKACNWAKLKLNIISTNLGFSEYKHFKVPGKKLMDNEYSAEKFNTFDDFKKINSESYNVLLPVNNNYLKGECDCPQFLKYFMCKHVIGLGIKFNIVEPPPCIKNIPSKKRKCRSRSSDAEEEIVVYL